ncbi:MAG: pyruvate:ferredoxin (flavodoxin) oxidoreductase [Pseudomonadota bacterium]
MAAVTIDGNEAAATIAHLCSEVVAIYPITPASPMGELADAWSATGRQNFLGSVPTVIEMQSEGGAAGAIHGALQAGALTTTFTASQGLLLMLPNMYKIAGELTPAVFHVAARTLATHALSIFCDHSDVMAARSTGFAMLCAGSVQETMDMALISHAATLAGQIPILHFFDGFRTSHEIAKIDPVTPEMVAAMLSRSDIARFRSRALSPEHPVLRGSAQNPDVFFQSREAVTPYYRAMPGVVQQAMDDFAGLTGRFYHLFDYEGAADAERVLVMMGSGAETAGETIAALARDTGEKVGLVKVRLYRPFDAAALVRVLPATTKQVAVLDRTREPGADGEPLYKDVMTALAAAYSNGEIPLLPRVVGGRYGLSSKEFTPAMVKGVLDAMKTGLHNGFTVGIVDDVSGSHVAYEPFLLRRKAGARAALFYGLGSDGTVSANKHSIKIIGDSTDLFAQGFFEYDSKKSGAMTISHLRFGPEPIRASYLLQDGEADFIACHQTQFLARFDILARAAKGGVFLLNTSVPPANAWDSLPQQAKRHIAEQQLSFYVIDAYRVAAEVGMGKRINTIMQTCFFAIAGVLPREQAIAAIKDSVAKSYGKKGRRVIEFNFSAIDMTLQNLSRVEPGPVDSDVTPAVTAIGKADDTFVQQVTARMIRGEGNLIPVSQLPADGTFPTGTAALEKRNLALAIPVLETDLCTQCGKCVFVCPHSAIRSKVFTEADLAGAPATFKSMPVKSKDFEPGLMITYQVAPEDCTGCTLCADACPIRDKSRANRKALNMAPQPPLLEAERENWTFFESLPDYDRTRLKPGTIPGAMLMQPLFEFSGACAGCGETPYLRLASQLFGDRMLIANATGCSSIYGGNLPTTPWSRNADGRGPAWSNSLFEDNAEFGLGMRAALDQRIAYATDLLGSLAAHIDPTLVQALLGASQASEAEIAAQRLRVTQLREALDAIDLPAAQILSSIADLFVRRSVWIVGGDGWAYDIGFGGVDHVLASGKDVNILVLDTEVYSNTGGQMSKATPRGAVAKFSAAGKAIAKKNLARIAMDYEHVYVAQVAYGAKDTQTLHAFQEAEAYPGTSLIIAYSPCIAHGVDLEQNLKQQDLAVRSGHWNLLRFDPARAADGKNPLLLDSKTPSIRYEDFAYTEARFKVLESTHPDVAARLLDEAQHEALSRHHHYEQLAGLSMDEVTTPEAKS